MLAFQGISRNVRFGDGLLAPNARRQGEALLVFVWTVILTYCTGRQSRALFKFELTLAAVFLLALVLRGRLLAPTARIAQRQGLNN